MTRQDQPNDSLQDIHDIRRIMERSSRFISLSGLSGIAAGVCALVACFIGREMINSFFDGYNDAPPTSGPEFLHLKIKLLLLAGALLVIALGSSLYFTWRRAKHDHVNLWDISSRKLMWNMLVPLIAGGVFTLTLVQHGEWAFIAPACLIFYGLALVSGSKYTLSDIRYLGYLEIMLGLVNTQFVGEGLYFWALGFGVLHIFYGAMMWWKYERVSSK